MSFVPMIQPWGNKPMVRSVFCGDGKNIVCRERSDEESDGVLNFHVLYQVTWAHHLC